MAEKAPNNQLTGGVMKSIVIGLLLWFMLTLSGSAESAGEMYRVVTFKSGVKNALKSGGIWKACGAYFAATESTGGKIVHFSFERRLGGKLSTVFAFSKVDRITVSIDEKSRAPSVGIIGDIHGTKFVLKMNSKDYTDGLPCLANGTKI